MTKEPQLYKILAPEWGFADFERNSWGSDPEDAVLQCVQSVIASGAKAALSEGEHIRVSVRHERRQEWQVLVVRAVPGVIYKTDLS